MKRFVISLFVFLPAILSAQGGMFDRTVELNTVQVEAGKPLEEIGLQMTPLDSVTLRDNISNSMADVLALGSSIFIKSYGRGTLATASHTIGSITVR